MISSREPLVSADRQGRLGQEIERLRQDGYRLICQSERCALLARTSPPGLFFWRGAGQGEVICVEVDESGRTRVW